MRRLLQNLSDDHSCRICPPSPPCRHQAAPGATLLPSVPAQAIYKARPWHLQAEFVFHSQSGHCRAGQQDDDLLRTNIAAAVGTIIGPMAVACRSRQSLLLLAATPARPKLKYAFRRHLFTSFHAIRVCASRQVARRRTTGRLLSGFST